MAKVYTEEELNNFSRETLMAVILSMQDQIHQLNTNMERLIEQIADANNKRYGRSSEKLETISGQLELELIFNEAEALTETLYVVEPVEEDVIQPRRKNKGKREADLKDLPIEVIVHTLSEEKLQDVFGTDGWKQLPDEIYKRVRVQPAVYTVEEHHVAVYAGKDNQTIIKADHPEEFLKDFKGIVVCDGYSAYRKLDRENPDIVFAGCWSHARRRFAEALKALPKAAQKNAKETVAYEAVSRIAAIYHLDNQMEGQPAKVRKMYRQANIRPLVEAFFAWAKEIQIKNQLSRGKTLDGINYCINQEVSLKAFLEDGDIPMDNNATESALRSFCLHKHTWVLNGATVLYGSASELRATLDYDFAEEKKFSYKNLSMEEIIHHLAFFVSRLWQIHVFGEGNTRTTAVFFIKYLRTLGFDATNDIFAENAWYFRNALVRANYNDLKNGVHETTEYLELFLRNLLLDEKNELHNRTMHISGRFAEVDIERVKVDIKSGEVDIESTKVDIRNKLLSFSDTISEKTINHTVEIFSKCGKENCFGRTIVEEITGLKPSRASKLIKLLVDSEVIVPVTGHGKGKYRFQ